MADRARRAGRTWTLSLPMTAYAGAYEHPALGLIEVATRNDSLALRFGAMQALAEPFTAPDSVRVEFVPYEGEPILFRVPSGAAAPDALLFRKEVFPRRS